MSWQVWVALAIAGLCLVSAVLSLVIWTGGQSAPVGLSLFATGFLSLFAAFILYIRRHSE